MPETVVTLRHVTAGDQAFLERLFVATHRSEFASIGSDSDGLLRSQHAIQSQAYSTAFDVSGDHIVEHDDGPIGRIWVDSSGDEWTLVDLAVLPDYQRLGIGTILVSDLVDQAEGSGATLRLTVRSDNFAALRLYLRNGFTVEFADEINAHMIRRSSVQRRKRFEQLRAHVLADVALQERLRNIPSDQLVTEIVGVAASLGLEIDAADVAETQRSARAEWIERWI